MLPNWAELQLYQKESVLELDRGVDFSAAHVKSDKDVHFMSGVFYHEFFF